ncbi:MAG: hypothetical protein ACYDCL_04145 [Myxococcales bacterium]
MPLSGALLLGSLLLADPSGAGAELQAGIGRFHSFDDDGAAALLKQSLADRPTAEQAAQAHLYLGLIAFNVLRGPEARAEFELALQASPYAELPEDASPKAKLLLVQVRQQLAAAPAPAVAPAPAIHASEGRPSRWAAWTLAAAAAAALGTGAGFGWAQGQAQAGLKAATDAGQATATAQAVGRDGLVADVLFGAGAAAGVAALVLFLLPAHADGATASVSLGPGTLRAQVSW